LACNVCGLTLKNRVRGILYGVDQYFAIYDNG
jgi:transcription elongation factor Elf1